MSRLFSESFDFWPITTPTVGSVVEETVDPWAGAASAACASGAFNIAEVHPVGVLGRHYYYRIAGRLDKLPENTTAILRLLVGEVNKLEVSINESGEVRMWNGVAHPTETPPKIAAGDWYVLEVMCQVNAEGNGKVSWRFNGIEKAAEQAFAVGNAAINKVRFGNPGGVKSGTPVVIDGLAINDDQGTSDNTWVGVEPDPAPTQLPRYWGADIAETEASGPTEPAPYNEELWDDFEADVGRKAGIIHMGDPWEAGEGPIWDGFFTGATDRIHARGAIPLKSLGGPTNVIRDVNLGVYDAELHTYAEAARDFGHPFFLRLWWEMNLLFGGFHWGMTHATGEEFVSAWRRVHGIISPIAPNATFVWCPNILFKPTPESDPFTGSAGNFYPGDAYVDWVGMDGYNGQNPAVPLGWRTSQAVFLETYERLVEKCPNKPQIICEVGCSEWFTKEGPEPPHKAEWIRQLLEWTLPFEMPNVRALVWFNWYIEHEKGRVDWPIESSPSATAAFAAAIADPSYVDPAVRFFPELRPVPLPIERSRVAVNREFPPGQYSVIVRAPDGTPIARWAQDETKPENVVNGLQLSGTMPGGKKELKATLPRNPRQNWPDLEGFLEIECQGPGRDRIWHGRIRKAPRSDGDRIVIDGQAVGWAAALEDRKALRIGFIDRALERLGEIPAERRHILEKLGIDLGAVSTSVDPFGSGSAGNRPAGASFSYSTLKGGIESRGELLYNSGGIDLAEMRYDFEGRSAEDDVRFFNKLDLSRDGISSDVPGTDHNTLTALQQSVPGGGVTGLRYAILTSFFDEGETDPWIETFRFANIVALADTGLTPQGTWPNIYFTAAQMLRYAVPLHSVLEVSDDSIEDDGFPIEQAWFPDPGTLARFVDEMVKYGLYDWFVKDAKLFELRQPGTYGRRWQAYQGPSNFEEAGEDTDRLWDRIVVSYQDTSGVTRYVGYPGSGCEVEEASLQITDPDHPAVRAGTPREDLLAIGSISSAPRALEAGERWLQEANELSRSGKATLSGFVMDDCSVFRPVEQIAEGDLMRFPDARDTSYRKVVNYEADVDNHKVSVDLDAPSESVKALLERYDAKLKRLGL